MITDPAGVIPPFYHTVTSCDAFCSVKNVDIVGASHSAESSPEIRQEYQYSLQAQTEMNCPRSKQLLYKWEIYSVHDKVINRISTPASLEPNLMELVLWPFSLKGGLYKIILTVTSQPCGILKSSSGFIRVRMVNLVARIECGNVRSVSWDTKVLLDASESYDPSYVLYGNRSKKDLNFEWACKDVHGVNCRERINVRNKSKLELPPRFFNSFNSTYLFVVNVSKGSRFSEARQAVEVRKFNFTSSLCIR